MSVKSRLDGLERQMNLAAAALRKTGRLAVQIVVINDPEAGLEEFRLADDDQTKTIEIGSLVYPGEE